MRIDNSHSSFNYDYNSYDLVLDSLKIEINTTNKKNSTKWKQSRLSNASSSIQMLKFPLNSMAKDV